MGGEKGGGSAGWGPEGGASNFALFFPSPAAKFVLAHDENSKRAHLSAPALQTPPKFHEKTPQRGKERTNFAAGEGKKKSEILGGPAEGGPGKGGIRGHRT